MGRLQNLTEKERREIAALRAQGYSIAACHRAFYEHNNHIPPENRYDYPTILAYFRSEQGVREVEEEARKIKDQAANLPYVHRGDRLSVLRGNLERLLRGIRNTPLEDHKTLIAFSAEIRQVIRELREESVPYDTEGVQIKSYYQEFIEAMATLPKDTIKLINSVGDIN